MEYSEQASGEWGPVPGLEGQTVCGGARQRKGIPGRWNGVDEGPEAGEGREGLGLALVNRPRSEEELGYWSSRPSSAELWDFGQFLNFAEP